MQNHACRWRSRAIRENRRGCNLLRTCSSRQGAPPRRRKTRRPHLCHWRTRRFRTRLCHKTRGCLAASSPPEPRIAAGIALRKLGISSCMDLSDGLSLDLARLCTESGVSAEIGPALPVAPHASLDEALHGGEDYELLFTASSRMK